MTTNDIFDECERILKLFNLKTPPLPSSEECKHKNVTRNDDGWYVCVECHEELRYNPNIPPIKLSDLYFEKVQIAKMSSRIKSLYKWLYKYKLPFEEELMIDFYSFINKYIELYPERKNLISKDYILYHLLRKRGYKDDDDEEDDGCIFLRLPKMKKTLDQNENMCRAIFESLNWSY